MSASAPNHQIAQIDVDLKWSEGKPGWIAEGYLREFRDAAHVRARGDYGGINPIPSIMTVVNTIAIMVNCHPANTVVMVKISGGPLMDVYERLLRQ